MTFAKEKSRWERCLENRGEAEVDGYGFVSCDDEDGRKMKAGKVERQELEKGNREAASAGPIRLSVYQSLA